MNKVKFTIEGDIPSKKNSKRILKNAKTGKNFIDSSVKFKAWEKREVQLLTYTKNVKGISKPIEETTLVSLTFLFKNKAVKDLTNAAEGVMDTLVKAGILKDDKWTVCPNVILNGFISYDKKSRCEIEIVY